MTIENKELFNLFKSVKTRGFEMDGLYLEGFSGGITAYATDGKAAYRKTFYGNNKDKFVYYFAAWQIKDGVTEIGEIKDHELEDKSKIIKIKALFDQERFNFITVNYNEFKKVINSVDAINRGEKTRHIILSIHNGKFDIASWNYAGSASWQLEGDYTGNGAFMISKKYLDGVKADKTIELSFGEVNGKIAMYISGNVDAVIMPLEINPVEFKEVLEYEVPKFEKQIETVIEKPTVKTRKLRTPRIKRENGAFTGWTYNRLGTRQIKVCNW